VLTAHESLIVPGVVIRPPRCRAHACNAGVRSAYGHEPRKVHLQALVRLPLPPKPASAQPDSFTAPIQHPTMAPAPRLKSHR
jgi:hypothetical protein